MAVPNVKRWRGRGLAAIALLVMGALPVLIETPYYLHLVTLTLIWVVMTQGLNVIQGYAGYVSICQGTFFGIGAYSSGIVTSKLGWPVELGFLIALVAGIVFGLVIGWPALRTKGHYFAIATMAFAVLASSVMLNWVPVTGGDAGLQNIPRPEVTILGVDLSSRRGYYYIALVFAAISIWFVGRLVRSRMGRSIIAVRENERVAMAVGIDTGGAKLMAFTISSTLGSMAGAVYAHYINFINPTPFHLDTSLNAILAVIIGGSGTVWGPVVGSAVVVFLPEYLRLATTYRMVLFGAVLILVTIFMPRGIIFGTAAALSPIWHRIRGVSDAKRRRSRLGSLLE